MRHLLSLPLQHEHDVVTARQRAGHIAQLLGLDASEQTRVATAVSEIVRNAFRYAREAAVTFAVDEAATPQRLLVSIADHGPGIPRLDDVLAGRYRSGTGMGLGIVGARRLMDQFKIESSPAGTTVVLGKFLSPRHPLVTSEHLQEIANAVAEKRPAGLIEEIQQQNQALLRALNDLQRKQQELTELNRELEDTNRGVVALYAELDEKADHLRRADELKSRFLSNMTHEFRTPVNSIIGLAQLMIDDRQQQGRPPEPEVIYIRKAAEQLSELVSDLLDLAQVEAGKTVIRPAEFEVQNLFGALRGMLRPMLLNQSVSLVFEEPSRLPPVYSDEGKISQVLRNLISNALKFTERGEVRAAAVLLEDGDRIQFTVADTGIGIAPEDQDRIFEEFTQLDHHLQRRVKGTGLGLPLSRQLAGLLGGTLTVESQPGTGSTFTLTLPVRYHEPALEHEAFAWVPDSGRVPLLVFSNEPEAQYFYEKVLRTSAYQLYPAYSVHEAKVALERMAPVAIVLDVVPAEPHAWELLVQLRRDERTARTPIIVISSGNDRGRALALGADACLAKPIDRRSLVDTLVELQQRHERPIRVLLIDDEEVARYLIRQLLPVPLFEVAEAASAEDGLRRARDDRPDVILLDLVMPDRHGLEVLRQLRSEAATGDIPVIVVTSKAVAGAERDTVLRDADGLLSKAELSRGTLGEFVRAAAARRAESPLHRFPDRPL
jgi:signal transduction histidine kinase/CheY-like chemotaxis protein